MKKSTILSFALFLILLSTVSNAQLLRFGIGGGLTSINSPDAFTKSISDGGMGFTTNYHITAVARLDIPLVPITPGVFIDYHFLRGSGTYSSQSINTTMNIFSFGVEGQYNIVPLPLVKPYAAIDLAYNRFGDLQVSSPAGSLTQPGVSRYGAAIGVGALITAVPSMDLDFSVKYNFFNLLGKDSGEESINALTVNLILLF